jgi:hypothetical protein
MSQNVSIEVQGWTNPPPDDVLCNLNGSVAHVCVGGDVGSDPVPYFEFFRFARVVATHAISPSMDAPTCPRCGSFPRYLLTVEWEAGYECPEGNELCEYCVDGIVTSGTAAISFGPEGACDVKYQINVSYDLTSENPGTWVRQFRFQNLNAAACASVV